MFADRRSIFWTLCSVFVLAHAQTPTPDPASCESKSNTSCEECLNSVSCLWCNANSRCLDYPVKSIVPPSSVCALTEARWGLCQINLQILIISMCVIAGIIVLALLVCCCCCCCCKRERNGNSREDARADRQNQERSSRQKARRTEIQMRHDEIRQKYGIAKNNSYTRMNDK